MSDEDRVLQLPDSGSCNSTPSDAQDEDDWIDAALLADDESVPGWRERVVEAVVLPDEREDDCGS